MKEMNLFLVSIVLLVGFAGFAYAGVDNGSDSFESPGDDSGEPNETVVVLNESIVSNVSIVLNKSNVIVVLNEANETPLDENQTEPADVEIVEDLIFDNLIFDNLIVEDEEVIVYKESISDKVVSYVSGVVDKINEIHENLFFIIIIILGVLLLFVYSIFFNYSSAEVCFSKASSLHRKGEKAHVNGNYTKAKKLYNKSYLFRAKGEGIVSGGADDSAI